MAVRRALSVVAVVVGLVLSGGVAAAAEPDPPPATSLSFALSATRLTHGTALIVTARLTSAETGTPIPDAPVVVERRRPGTTAYAPLATLVSDSDGVVRFVTRPRVNAEYAVRHDGDVLLGASAAGPKRVDVAPRLRAVLNKTAARVGSKVTISGSVTPAHPGRTVRIERYYNGSWHLVTKRTLSAASSYTARLTMPATAGWKKYRVVKAADRNNLATSSAVHRVDAYRLHTYVVRTRGNVSASVQDFSESVAATYADRRGWMRGHDRFRRVASGGSFTVVLAQARYLPSYSSVCSAQYSCRVGRNVIINQDRWRLGSRYFPGTRTEYRQMVVNHETGHWLGNGHAYCRGKGQLAPVMQQQSKGMQGCKINSWPLSREL